jgi:hypothetical protein
VGEKFESRNEDSAMTTDPTRKESRRRIEKAYQRAMNIRDSMPSDLTDKEEENYAAAYRFAYRVGDTAGFRMATRKYLHDLRSFTRAAKALKSLGVLGR